MKSIGYKSIDFILFITFFILTSFGVTILRFLPAQSTIIVFISDTIGNIGGTLAASFLFIWYKDYHSIKLRVWVIFSVFLGFEAYELMQKFLPWATFDHRDLTGTLIGALLALIINVLIVIFSLNSPNKYASNRK